MSKRHAWFARRALLPLIAVLVGAAALGVDTEARADEELIVNGSFESPQLPNGAWQRFASITGWQLASGSWLEVQNRVAGGPYDGNQLVELDSDTSSAIYQDIHTVPGAQYRLSFAFSPRPGTPADDNILEVYWNGELISSVTRPGTGLSDTRWVNLSYTVKATSSLTRLELRDAGVPNGLGTYVDSISLRRR